MWPEIIFGLISICFSGVLLFGAPYLPTLKGQINAALKLAALKPGDHLIELGCGDGRVLIAAAKQGLKVTGYELNPLLVAVAWLRTRRYRRQVKIIWGNFWQQDWPPAEAVFTFLLPKYMGKLNTKMEQYKYRPVKLISHAFLIPRKKAIASQNGVHLYHY